MIDILLSDGGDCGQLLMEVDISLNLFHHIEVAFERGSEETAMRRRTFLRAAGAASLLAQRVPAAGKQYFAYWGTYTTSVPRFANGESKGIYVSRLNTESGRVSTPELAAETKSPSYLAVHPSGRFLYAVNELRAD